MTPSMKPTIRYVIAALTIVLSPTLFGATGTISPSPYLTVLDNNGNPASLACVWTYTAGTSTPVATYTDVALSVANANPIIASTAGRFTAFLTPGVSYKFIIELAPCSSIAHGTTLVTADNIAAMPTTSSGIDVLGTAGETFTAGQAAYLSDGSGGKNAGQWYRADTANGYSSTTPMVGLAPSAITSGSSGTIRLSGAVTGLSSLTIGARYYVSTSGTITTTGTRFVGQADTTTSLVVAANPPPPAVNNAVDSFRVSVSTGVCVPAADVTAATTIYLTPCFGNTIALYDGTTWNLRTSAQISIAVPATTSQLYDIFVYDNAGVATLELLAWTNDTTRATALTTQDGVLAKTGALTRRYVGSFRTTTVSGQTEDSAVKRYVWNYYHRVRRRLYVAESTATWNYTTATVRQTFGNTANQVDIVVGVAEVVLQLTVNSAMSNGTTGVNVSIGIGEDSTTVTAANMTGGFAQTSTIIIPFSGYIERMPAVGRHFYAQLEWSAAVGTTAWIGTTAAVGNTVQGGLVGWIEG